MDTLLILVVVAGAAAACFYAARGRPTFVVAVMDGKLRVVHGHPPPFFLQDAEDIVRESRISAGVIKGYVNGVEMISATDDVFGQGGPALNQKISRWHFELRRGEHGFLLRSVTDSPTEVDGTTLAKTAEAPIKPGSKVRLAKVLTLEFLGDGTKPLETAGEITKYTP